MTTTAFNTHQTVNEVVPNIFETMLGLSASPDALPGPVPADRVSGTIGIAGDTLAGAVYVHLPEAFAHQVVNAMLGNPADQPVGDGDLNDVVGELTNMIGGGLKSALCDAAHLCAMSTPSIIRGNYAVETPQDWPAENFHFLSQGHRLTVEVHLKFN